MEEKRGRGVHKNDINYCDSSGGQCQWLLTLKNVMQFKTDDIHNDHVICTILRGII